MRDHLGQFAIAGNLNFTRGVLLIDDMEGTSRWMAGGTGGDHSVTFDANAAFTGTNGLQIVSRTTAADAGDLIEATRNISLPETGLLVFRFMLGMVNKVVCAHVEWSALPYLSTRQWRASIRWDVQNQKLQYRNAAGTYTDIVDLGYDSQLQAWYPVQLTLDLNTQTYLSTTFNGVTYDLSGIPFHDQGDATTRFLAIQFDAQTQLPSAVTIYVDNAYAGEFLDL